MFWWLLTQKSSPCCKLFFCLSSPSFCFSITHFQISTSLITFKSSPLVMLFVLFQKLFLRLPYNPIKLRLESCLRITCCNNPLNSSSWNGFSWGSCMPCYWVNHSLFPGFVQTEFPKRGSVGHEYCSNFLCHLTRRWKIDNCSCCFVVDFLLSDSFWIFLNPKRKTVKVKSCGWVLIVFLPHIVLFATLVSMWLSRCIDVSKSWQRRKLLE